MQLVTPEFGLPVLAFTSRRSMVILSESKQNDQNHQSKLSLQNYFRGAPVGLSRLSVCLQLRSCCQGSGIEPRIRLPAQRGTCFSLSLCLPLCLLVLSLSLCQINKIFFKKKKKLYQKSSLTISHRNFYPSIYYLGFLLSIYLPVPSDDYRLPYAKDFLLYHKLQHSICHTAGSQHILLNEQINVRGQQHGEREQECLRTQLSPCDQRFLTSQL